MISNTSEFRGAFETSTNLTLTVRAFPGLDLPTAFVWVAGRKAVTHHGVRNVKLEKDTFESTLMIENVAEDDYIVYNVTVTNDIKTPSNFLLYLRQQGERVNSRIS